MSKITERFGINSEMAKELGVDINGKTEDMKAASCGKIGGKIGGEMVKRMIADYENKINK